MVSGIGSVIKNSFSYFYSYGIFILSPDFNLVPLRIRGGAIGGEEFKAYLQYNYSLNFSQTYDF